MHRLYFILSLPVWNGKYPVEPDGRTYSHADADEAERGTLSPGTNHETFGSRPAIPSDKRNPLFKMMETRLGIVSQRRLVKEKHRLQLLEQELKAASPENLLKRGYSITLKMARR